jgi:hypothetical protein
MSDNIIQLTVDELISIISNGRIEADKYFQNLIRHRCNEDLRTIR